MPAKVVKPEPPAGADPDKEHRDLLAAARSLVQGGCSTFEASNGRLIHFNTAKVRTLGQIMLFFREVAKSVPFDKLEGLFRMFSKAQRKALADGKDPKAVDISALTMLAVADSEVQEIVASALGGGSFFLSIAGSALEHGHFIVCSFTDLTREEFEDLELDDACVVVMGVLFMNYSFFTRSSRLILQVLKEETGAGLGGEVLALLESLFEPASGSTNP